MLCRDALEAETGVVGLVADEDVDAIITTGGTGISARDTTYEVASRMIDKKLDGFGEIFRMLSYEEVGAAAILSRAVAGAAIVWATRPADAGADTPGRRGLRAGRHRPDHHAGQPA